MKNEMKYFKLAVIWLAFISTVSLFGEYIISREVNGFLQLLSFVGLVGAIIYVINETINLFKKEEKND
jgi:hypothetical protein